VPDLAQKTSIEDGQVTRIARAEELLAMKVLSYREGREKDLADACSLVRCNPALDHISVRQNLSLISERGYDRRR